MLDEYWFGDVQRISPEAPVPVVRVRRSEERPGGAANVARNIAALGAQATLLSVIGPDDTGTRLRRVVEESGIAHSLQIDKQVRTTLKLRIIGQHQQMLRVDFEDAPSDCSLNAKQAEFSRLLPQSDVVIFSDYGKGALRRVSSMIAVAKADGKLTVVDPKGRDYMRYAGADLITPNRGELEEVTGPWLAENEMDRKAEALRNELGVTGLLLTMSEQGMRLFREGSMLTKPARAKEIFDVSGAGDTVVAAIALMRGIGASWEQTVDFANAAAGVVVSRLGASVATFHEVLAEMGADEELPTL